MATDTEAYRRKHRRSASDEEDEKSLKRHKHRHHRRHHRHRHSSNKNEDESHHDHEDSVPPVAYDRSRLEDDLEEGEILEEDDFGVREDESTIKETGCEYRKIESGGIFSEIDEPPTESYSVVEVSHAEDSLAVRENAGNNSGHAKTLEEGKRSSNKVYDLDSKEEGLYPKKDLNKDEMILCPTGIDCKRGNDVSVARNEVTEYADLGGCLKGTCKGDSDPENIDQYEKNQKEMSFHSKGGSNQRNYFDNGNMDTEQSNLSNLKKPQLKAEDGFQDFLSSMSRDVNINGSERRSRSRSNCYSRGESHSRGTVEEEAESKRTHHHGLDRSLYDDKSKTRYDLDDDYSGYTRGEERHQSWDMKDKGRSKMDIDRDWSKETECEKNNWGLDKYRSDEREKGRSRERRSEVEQSRSKERKMDRDRRREKEREMDMDRRVEKERGLSREREVDREIRMEKERGWSREKEMDRDRDRRMEREREMDRVKRMEKERGWSRDREVGRYKRVEKDERGRSRDREVDRDRRVEKERGRSREREADRDRRREREKVSSRDRDTDWDGRRDRDRDRNDDKVEYGDRDKVREMLKDWDKERKDERNKKKDTVVIRSKDKYGSPEHGYFKTSMKQSRHNDNESGKKGAKIIGTERHGSFKSNALQGVVDKRTSDHDREEEDDDNALFQSADQEEEDLNRIKEESRRRRLAILEKYKCQQLVKQDEPSSEEHGKDKDSGKDSSLSGTAAHAIPEMADGVDDSVADSSFAVVKSSQNSGLAASEKTFSAGGLGEGTPKGEGSDDKLFCDDIFGETPTAVQKTGKGDGLQIDRNGLHDNWDDADGYYNYRFGEVLDGRYEITAAHGKGVFSTVVRAKNLKAGNGEPEEVAIKILRSNETMYKAGLEESVILKKLVGADPDDKRHCVRFLSSFKYRNHLCLVFESLHMNLREVLKKFGRNIGLKLTAVRAYAKQLFIALKHLRNCGVLHCDIKPDNMLVNEGKNVLKLCDFGNAMFAGKNEITPYLVSRFYRAPEIILGLPYDHPMDIWSVGCCLYELSTGKVLFPGPSNNDMLRLHMELKGSFPKKMLRKGAFTDQHFDQDLNFHASEEDPVTKKTIKRIIVNIKPKDIGSVIRGSPGEDPKMLANFKDLLDKIFVLDPDKRLTVSQALNHPFITGK